MHAYDADVNRYSLQLDFIGSWVNAFLIAGAPGVGKTTLLQAIRVRGLGVVGDTAREFIRERKSLGLPPRPPAAEFAAELFRRDAEQYERATHHSHAVFFERGIPDSLCLLNDAGLLANGELEEQLAKFVYDRPAFILPPWEGIFVKDEERDQTFTEALLIHEKVVSWYRRCGFCLLEVPIGTASQRCDFVLGELAHRRG